MLAKRIIPCLDIQRGRVVKGKQFEDLTDAGDPVELAGRYSDEGADEIVILDISATLEDRRPFYEMVEQIASKIAIPLTAGGGVRSIDQIVTLLRCGADKVTLNSILAENPEILSEAAVKVGSQALVAAMDVRKESDSWNVRIRSGTKKTKLDAFAWARRVTSLGAGELLVTSIDRDGTKTGYDCTLLRQLSEMVRVPIIASGGAGTKDHILSAFKNGNADAVLAASIFHFNEIGIQELKTYLNSFDIPVRL